ncbi:hypothetical protein BRPE64_BCDS04870 [Caballeronia insecticola]|uniref:Uncharacterized protein n=1 Tax=Caballeronia insecticola TaxID=758793 RepID=R4WKR5_9BURK|nr:hypothetical protein BRPE64_BCDS04870 [Caballeronia insecticola]
MFLIIFVRDSILRYRLIAEQIMTRASLRDSLFPFIMKPVAQ